MKNVVVTGGSSGIGLAVVRELVAGGHTVDVMARRTPEEFAAIEDVPTVAGYHQIDLTDADLAAAELGRIAATRGGIDVLVNNAGIMQYANVADATAESIAAQLDVNLRAPIRLAAAAVADFQTREAPGLIINMASVAGLKATPKLAVYSASKAGLIQYTRSLALECAGERIRAVAIAPGAVSTGLTNRVMFAMIERGMPLSKLQTAAEIASLVGWLVSDDAANVTGSVFSIDGGMSL